MSRMHVFCQVTLLSFFLVWQPGDVRADIFATEFFTGRIQRYDEATKASTVFAMIDAGPGLSGIAINQSANRLYASALNHGGIYSFDLRTGANLGFHSLGGFGPGGITVSSAGEIYVTDFASGNLRIYDSSFSSPLQTIAVSDGGTSGVGILANGDVLITTLGEGVFRYSGGQVSQFSLNQLASAQVAQSPTGDIFIGHGVGYSDSVFKFDIAGNPTGSIEITSAMIDGLGGSSPGTSPSGVVFDGDGNLIVAVLGQANPGDANGERGGLLKFSPEGVLLDTIASGTNAYSSVAYVSAVPEPSALILVATSALATIGYRRRKCRRVGLLTPRSV